MIDGIEDAFDVSRIPRAPLIPCDKGTSSPETPKSVAAFLNEAPNLEILWLYGRSISFMNVWIYIEEGWNL